MIRATTTGDEAALRTLQSLLDRSEPMLVDAACGALAIGRIAVVDRPVGYAIAIPGEPATLAELAVRPSARRNGYGRALVESVAEPVEGLVATTRADDAQAVAFYRALGFDVGDQLPGFYGDGSDGLRLRRRA